MTDNPLALRPLDEWRHQGDFFDHQGLRIFAVQSGTADLRPTLLLIHGFPTASWDWSGLWEPLARRFRVLTLDLIGYGFSDKPKDFDYRIGAQADLLEAFLARHDVREYHVLAHDYGDTVAQELLARHLEGKTRQKLRSICFLNGGLFPEMHRARFVQKLLLTPLGPFFARRMNRKRFGNSFNAVLSKPASERELDGFWALLRENDGLEVLPKLIRYIPERRANRDRWVGALEAHNIPLRVIDGADDPVSGQHMVFHYRKLVPRPDIVLLRGVGHYPQVEAPAETLRHFLEFHDMLPSTLMHFLEDGKR
ncbi:MAG: alpha/beta fold hydrolase [Betaproteobacteria bacterium]|nr:alpha/beta fold hydrolase [Betaproteobacteria bacterium]